MMMFVTLPDPDFEISGGGEGGGGRSTRPFDKFGLKIEGRGAGLPGRFPGSATLLTWNRILLMLQLHPWTKRGEKILGGRSGKSLPPFSLSVLVFSFLFLVYCTVCFVASYK